MEHISRTGRKSLERSTTVENREKIPIKSIRNLDKLLLERTIKESVRLKITLGEMITRMMVHYFQMSHE